MGRLSRSLGRRTKRLSRAARRSWVAFEETRCFEACTRLSKREVQLLSNALRREEHLAGDAFPQLEVSPEEREAIAAFNRAYEAVRAEWGA